MSAEQRLAWRTALHGQIDGRPDVVADLGDAVGEHAALEHGAALHLRADRALWRVTGADAQDYLHRMLTQDIRALAVGRGTRACLLEPKGRVLGDFVVWRRADEILLDGPRLSQTQALPRLEQFVIADDVVIEDRSEAHVRFVLAGPQLTEAMTALQLEVPEEGELVERTHPESGAPLLLLGAHVGEQPVVEGLTTPDGAHAWLEGWVGPEALRPVGRTAFEAWRIAAGEPRLGHELRTDALFNEARLERAVSWAKGCYPGQEPVVMARHRGRPPNLLVHLAVEGGDVPEPLSELCRDGRALGRVTSAARVPGTEQVVMMALVRTAVADDAEGFELPDGRSAQRRD